MTEIEHKKDEPVSCGCSGKSCCSGSGRWIWIILALAVGGVLMVKHGGKKEATPPPVTNISSASSGNDSNQTQAVPRLVDLGAGKCVPCKMMAPILEELKKSYAGKMDVVFIDVWENPDAGKKYGVNVIPTQIFYNEQGKELFRHEGFFSKEDILGKWKELGVELKM